MVHTKNIAGSHVIIKAKNGEISDNAILQAASLAAYCSKAQNSTKVPVDYTRIRFVKKPNGAKPGMVIFTNNYTVLVDQMNSFSQGRGVKKSGNQRKDKNKMKKELAKTYSPKDFEDRLYHEWEEKKYFHAEIDPRRSPIR